MNVYPPPLVRGEDTFARGRGGWGVNILEDARHYSVLYICNFFVVLPIELEFIVRNTLMAYP